MPKRSLIKPARAASRTTRPKKKTGSTHSIAAWRRRLQETERRLAEAEETLAAIRSGEVDALVVTGAQGEQVFTLRDAARPYQDLVEEMNEGVLTLSADGHILYANARFAEMLHLPLGQILGEVLARFTRSEDATSVRPLLHAALQGRCRAELTLYANDTPVPVQISLRNFVVDGIPRLSALVADLTERKQAEERVRRWNAELEQRVQERTAELQNEAAARQEAERKANDLIRYAPTAIFEIDFRGPRFVAVNDAMWQMLGYTREELLATGPFALLDDDSVRRFKERIQNTLAGEPVDPMVEYRVRVKDGSFRDAILDTSVMYEAGQPVGAFVIAHDMTERRRAEKALRESEGQYRELADSISDPFFALDRELCVTYWNHASEKNTGVEAESIIGKSVLDLFPEVKGTRLETLYRQVLATGQTQYLENRWERPDGRSNYVDVSIYPTANGIAVFSHDVTERKRAEEALRLSEQRLALAASATGIGIFDSNGLTGDIACTEQFGYLVGLRSTAVATSTSLFEHYHNSKWAERVHPDDWLGLRAKIDACQQQRRPLDAEYRVAGADGAERWVNVRGVFQNDAQGSATHILGVLIDITERKRTEEALRASEARWKAIYQHGPIGIAVGNLEGRLIFANPAFHRMLGYEEDELTGTNFRELTPNEDITAENALVGEILAGTRDHYDIEKRYLRKDGTVITINLSGTVLRDAEGKPAFGLAITQDITARKRAEEQLRQRSEELQAITEAVPVGVFITRDPGARTITGNRAARELLETPPETNISKTASVEERPTGWQEMRNGIPIASDDLPLQQAARGKEVRDYEMDLVFRDGTVKSVMGHATPLRDEQGNSQGGVAVLIDVTERKRTAESLREALVQIQTLNRDLERRAGELEVANEELERLATSLALDLRSPLVSLRSVSQALAQDYGAQLPPQAQSLFRLVRANAEEMEDLTQGLVQVMRVTRQTLHLQDLNPEGIVRAAWADLQSECGDHLVELTIDPLPNCRADRLALKQVWVNLLSNALKATRNQEPAKIQVGAQTRGQHVTYFVKDNGIGFDMSYAGTIFRAFQRYHHADEWQGGSGVGLAIVESIIRRHGGRVWAEGAVNQGATFYFEV